MSKIIYNERMNGLTVKKSQKLQNVLARNKYNSEYLPKNHEITMGFKIGDAPLDASPK